MADEYKRAWLWAGGRHGSCIHCGDHGKTMKQYRRRQARRLVRSTLTA